MATRLYYGNLDIVSTDYSPNVDLAPRKTWGSESVTECYLAPAGHANLTTYSGVVRNLPTGASSGTICRCVAVSPPLAAGYTWDSATFRQVSRHAQSVDANTFMMYYVGIINNDGTTIKFSTTLEKEGGDHAISTTAASKTNDMVAGKLVGDSIAGDRIFVEVGDDKDSATSTDLRMAFLYSTTAGDLSTVEGDTGVQNLWLETSLNVTFDPEGTVYGSTSKLMLMGVG